MLTPSRRPLVASRAVATLLAALIAVCVLLVASASTPASLLAQSNKQSTGSSTDTTTSSSSGSKKSGSPSQPTSPSTICPQSVGSTGVGGASATLCTGGGGGSTTAVPSVTANPTTQYTGENVWTNYPSFTLTNNGNTTGTYTVTISSCSGAISGCVVHAQPASLGVGRSATLQVDYQSGYAANGTGSLAIEVTSQYNEDAYSAVTIVPLSENVSVTAGTAPAAPHPSQSATYPFTVVDVGNNSDPTTYTLSASCTGALSCGAASPTSVTITPSGAANATITAAAAIDSAGGSGTVRLTASYTNVWGKTYSDWSSFNVTVPDARTYMVAVSPTTTTAYNEPNVSTSYSFTLTNSGNTQATYTVTLPTCTGTASGCSFASGSAVTSKSVAVSPNNGTVSVPVYFTTRGVGQNASITLQAAGTSNTASGSITVVPLAPTVSVSGGSAVSMLTNRSATVQFTVRNTGTSGTVSYNIGYTCPVPLTNCTAPATVNVPQGQSAPVTLNFQTASGVGIAQITLTATAPRPPFVNLYQGSASDSVYVNSSLTASTDAMNNDDQDMSVCAMSCFAVTATHSTVPYYTLNTPRNIALVYNGDRAVPQPFIYADVTVDQAPASLTGYLLEVKYHDVDLAFTNHETVLHFQGTSSSTTPYRLAGQVDMTTYQTGMYPVKVIVTAQYANGTSDVTTVNTQLLVVNTGSSPIARGWSIAGLQRLYAQPGGGYVVDEGGSSAAYFSADHSSTADHSILDSAGGTWTRTYLDGSYVQYAASGLMTAAVDQWGLQTKYQYDTTSSSVARLRYVFESLRANGYSSTAPYLMLTYDANGNGLSQITEVGTANPRTTGITVNPAHLLTQVTDPDSAYESFGYDASGRLNSVTDRRRNTTTFSYDGTGKLSQITSPAVPIDAGNETTTWQSPTVHLSAWQSVGVPVVATVSSPAAVVQIDTVTARLIDPMGRVTAFTVNRWGEALTTIDPVGRETVATYAGKKVTSIVYPDGATDSYAYDSSDRVRVEEVTGDSATFFHYNAASQVDSSWGLSRVATYYTYNPDRTLASTKDANGVSMTYAYNGHKQVISATDNAGHITSYAYDATLGNTDTTIAPGGRTNSVTTDGYGRPATVSSPGAAGVTITYDLMNRPRQIVQGTRPATVLTYDGLLRTDVQDANGNVTHTEYDALGNAIARRDAAGMSETFRYDITGRLTSWTNRRHDVMAYTYDNLDRLTSRAGRNINDSYSYSADGNIQVAWNAVERDSVFHVPAIGTPGGDSTVTRVNGARYRVFHGHMGALGTNDSTVISTSTTGVWFRPRYTMIATSGLPTQIEDGFNTMTVRYDTESLPISEVNTLGIARDPSWTALHTLSSVVFNTIPFNTQFGRSYHYDSAGRIDAVGQSNNATQQLFHYDQYGQLSEVDTQTGCNNGIGYDANSGWLFPCNPATVSAAYSYDDVGNRTDLNATYDAGNRLRNFSGGWYAYDADGNVSQKYLVQPGGHNQLFYWNPENRLDSLSYDGGATVRYEYNAFGQPVKKYRNGVVDRVWLWDSGALLAEFDASNQRLADYQYRGIDQPYGVDVGGTKQTAIQYHVQDALGNVIGTYDGTTIKQTVTYDPWGMPSYSGDLSSRLMWKGLMWEGGPNNTPSDVVGLYYMRGRWYDPQAGRFIQEDPLGVNGGLNLYGFAGDDPVNGTDPTGKDPWSDCMDGLNSFGPQLEIALSAGDDYEVDVLFRRYQAAFNQCNTMPHFLPPVAIEGGPGSDLPAVSAWPSSAGDNFLQQGNFQYLSHALFGTLKPRAKNWAPPGTDYCGPGGSGPVLNSLDGLCNAHDICYLNAQVSASFNINPFSHSTPQQMRGASICNQQLCDGVVNLSKAAFGKPMDVIDRLISQTGRNLVYWYFHKGARAGTRCN